MKDLAHANLIARPELVAALAEVGVAHSEDAPTVVFDSLGAGPETWAAAREVLTAAFDLARQAKADGAPIVVVVDGAAVYGHAGPLSAAVAAGLLGGVRSQAVEGQRKGIPAFAVTASKDKESLLPAAAAIRYALSGEALTGQVLHADLAHVGRPAA